MHKWRGCIHHDNAKRWTWQMEDVQHASQLWEKTLLLCLPLKARLGASTDQSLLHFLEHELCMKEYKHDNTDLVSLCCLCYAILVIEDIISHFITK